MSTSENAQIYTERRLNKPSGGSQSSYISPNTYFLSHLSILWTCNFLLIYAYIRYKHTTSGPDPMLIKRVYCMKIALSPPWREMLFKILTHRHYHYRKKFRWRCLCRSGKNAHKRRSTANPIEELTSIIRASDQYRISTQLQDLRRSAFLGDNISMLVLRLSRLWRESASPGSRLVDCPTSGLGRSLHLRPLYICTCTEVRFHRWSLITRHT